MSDLTRVRQPRSHVWNLRRPAQLGRKEVVMASTFLHEDKMIPPDEAAEAAAPECPRCKCRMWLLRVTTKTTDGTSVTSREYECKTCRTCSVIDEEDNKMDDVIRDCPL
jgi:hypothetical protein